MRTSINIEDYKPTLPQTGASLEARTNAPYELALKKQILKSQVLTTKLTP